jgi:hypothetical protein
MLGHIIPVAGSRVQVPSRRTVFVLWTLVLAATAVLVGRALLAERQTVDDVFIFLRYARNLAEHGRYAFNPGGPGIPVEGTSSVLWTLVLAAAWRAGWRGLGTAKLVSLVAGALVPATCAVAVRRAVPGRPLLAAVPALVLALDADLATWSASGMDTAVWTLACAGIVVLATRPNLAAVALGALAWVRPEGPLLAALGVLALSRDRKTLVRLALLAAAPLAVLTLGRLAYFHAAVPNTFWAKMNAVDGKDYTGLGYVGSALTRRPLLLLVVPVAALLLRARIILGPAARLALALLAGSLLFALLAGGDWMPDRRLLVVALPLAAVVAAITLAGAGSRLFALATCAALALEAGLTVDRTSDQTWRTHEWLDQRMVRWTVSGHPFRDPYWLDWMPTRLLQQISPFVAPGDTVAHVDVGELPYVMDDVSFLDGFGLVDREAGRVAFSPRDPVLREAAREAFFAAHPAVAIVVLDEVTGRPFSPAQDAALADPRFAAGWREQGRVPTWGNHPCVTYVRRDVVPVAHAQAMARMNEWLARVKDVRALED